MQSSFSTELLRRRTETSHRQHCASWMLAQHSTGEGQHHAPEQATSLLTACILFTAGGMHLGQGSDEAHADCNNLVLCLAFI